MKVLIGVDGSQGALAATRMAAGLVSPDTDQIGFYYSVPHVTVGGQAAVREKLIEGAREELAKQVFEEARAELPEPLRQDVHLRIGKENPRRGLLAAADEWGAELIVVGARGRGPMASRLLGSVARSVVHAATVPVLIVRQKPVQAAADGLCILLAHEESDTSGAAVEFLSRLTLPPGSVGRVMTAVEPFFAGEVPAWLQSQPDDPEIKAMADAWLREHQATIEAKRAEIERLTGELPPAFRGTEPIVAEGIPADKILEVAKKQQVDLVVVGARGVGALARILVGSTSDQIVLYSHTSVLVVRPPKQG